MEMIGFLILFPLVVAGLLMVVRQNKARNIIICVGSAVIAAASIALVAANLGTPGLFFYFDSDAVSLLSFILDCVIVLLFAMALSIATGFQLFLRS